MDFESQSHTGKIDCVLDHGFPESRITTANRSKFTVIQETDSLLWTTCFIEPTRFKASYGGSTTGRVFPPDFKGIRIDQVWLLVYIRSFVRRREVIRTRSRTRKKSAMLTLR